MSAWLKHWPERHQHPLSLALHVIGIPLTVAAVGLAAAQLMAWRWDLWYRPVVLLTVGYLLQWIGHVAEGNDMGEVIFIKKRLGRPYTAVSPRYASRTEQTPGKGDDMG
jgi:hypothetical protein